MISQRLAESLRQDVLDGFLGYRFSHQGEGAYNLKFEFGYPDSDSVRESKGFSLGLDQLSTGQRTLVALFTILHAAVGPDLTLCIDEPDNYIALREIQPWLVELTDKVRDSGGQCLLISHHPELIDYLAADYGTRFFRENGGVPVTGPGGLISNGGEGFDIIKTVGHSESESEGIGQVGGGMEVRFTPHIGWVSDFSWNFVNGPKNNFGMARTGVNFAF